MGQQVDSRRLQLLTCPPSVPYSPTPGLDVCLFYGEGQLCLLQSWRPGDGEGLRQGPVHPYGCKPSLPRAEGGNAPQAVSVRGRSRSECQEYRSAPAWTFLRVVFTASHLEEEIIPPSGTEKSLVTADDTYFFW